MLTRELRQRMVGQSNWALENGKRAKVGAKDSLICGPEKKWTLTRQAKENEQSARLRIKGVGKEKKNVRRDMHRSRVVTALAVTNT